MINKILKCTVSLLLVMFVFTPFSVHANEEDETVYYGNFLGEEVPILYDSGINFFGVVNGYTYTQKYYKGSTGTSFDAQLLTQTGITALENYFTLPTALSNSKKYDIVISWLIQGITPESYDIVFYTSSGTSLLLSSGSFDDNIGTSTVSLTLDNIGFEDYSNLKYIEIKWYVAQTQNTVKLYPNNFTVTEVTESSGEDTGGNTGGNTGGSSSGSSTDVSYIEDMLDTIHVDLTAVQGEVAGLNTVIINNFTNLKNWIEDQTSVIKTELDEVSSDIQKLDKNIGTEFTNLKTSISTHFTNLSTWITNQTTSINNSISTNITNLKNSIDTFISNQTTSINNKLDEVIDVLDGDGSSKDDIDNNESSKDEFESSANDYNELEQGFQDNMNNSLEDIDVSNTIINGNDFIKTANFISTNMNRIVTSNNVYNSYVSSALILGLALILIGKRVI